MNIISHRNLMYFGCCFVSALLVLSNAPPLRAGQVIDRIRASGELVLGTPGDLPPFSVSTTSGELIGFDISFARELARNMGVNLQIKRFPFSELIEELLKGNVDIIMTGLSITARRNMEIAFVGPYGSSGQAFFGREELTRSLEDPLDLNQDGLKIGVLKNTTADTTVRALFPKVTPVYSESLDQALIMVLNGEVDGLISDYPYCKVSQYRYKEEGLRVFEKILSFEQLGIGVPPDDFLFINLLQNYINMMAGSGAIQTMQEYWFKNSDWIEQLPDLRILKNF
ncbi:MAG: transporter substrate-binding domain-containing protein [Desulfocapsaceae bacterium]|jgi:polar amino acid transport system substrate-binding protein|nr:transporter substrate-binding domain-containing protein [Desulfocapsaceae bacterium]